MFFIAPDDWVISSKFTEERFWLRARLEQGGYVKPPRIRMIITNAIDAYNQETIAEEILGSSDASPLQQFKFLRGPLLEDQVVEVRERQKPAPDDVAAAAWSRRRPRTASSPGRTGSAAGRWATSTPTR